MFFRLSFSDVIRQFDSSDGSYSDSLLTIQISDSKISQSIPQNFLIMCEPQVFSCM